MPSISHYNVHYNDQVSLQRPRRSLPRPRITATTTSPTTACECSTGPVHVSLLAYHHNLHYNDQVSLQRPHSSLASPRPTTTPTTTEYMYIHVYYSSLLLQHSNSFCSRIIFLAFHHQPTLANSWRATRAAATYGLRVRTAPRPCSRLLGALRLYEPRATINSYSSPPPTTTAFSYSTGDTLYYNAGEPLKTRRLRASPRDFATLSIGCLLLRNHHLHYNHNYAVAESGTGDKQGKPQPAI